MTRGDAAADLAYDDVLLGEVEAGADEVLRVWEPRETCVVLGRGSRGDEVRAAACAREGIRVLRRGSGGGAVVLAPGCVAYAVVLRVQGGRLSAPETMRGVVERHGVALTALCGRAVVPAGVADLALDGRKVSGNAQRRRRRAALVHGTVLYALDGGLAQRVLGRAPRPPAYRAGRSHAEFLGNVPAGAAAIKEALRSAWLVPIGSID